MRRMIDAVSNDTTDAGLAALADAGVTVSRYPLHWASLRPSGWNPYEADRLRTIFRRFQAHGIEPVLVLWGVPPGYEPLSLDRLGQALADDLNRLVAEHGYEAFGLWQAFNEIDVGFDWQTFGVPPNGIVNNPDPGGMPAPAASWDEHRLSAGRAWNEIMRQARAAFPDGATVLSAGCGHPETLEYLSSGLYDVASFHAYGSVDEIMEAARTARGLVSTPVWLTEMHPIFLQSTQDAALGDQEQADELVRFCRAWAAEAAVLNRALVYVWHNGRPPKGAAIQSPWYWLSSEAKRAIADWNAGKTPLEEPLPWWRRWFFWWRR